MNHPFDRYYLKHSHYPRIRIDNGVQRLTIEFHRGYTRIVTSAPYSGEIYITRSTWFKLLPKLIPITRKWAQIPAKDFDVPDRVHKAYLDELALDREKRELKKTQIPQADPAAQARQRRRWLKARERATRSRPS